MKKISRIILINILFPFLVLMALQSISLPETIIKFLTSLWLAFVYLILISILFSFRSKKRKNFFKGSLYGWTEELTGDGILTYQLKQMKTSYKTIDNLLSIKKIVLKATNSNLEKLKLYKAFYILTLKESTEELYYKIIIGLLSTAGVFALRELLSKIEDSNVSDPLLVSLMIIFSILVFTGVINEDKKRISLMIEIIDICILEIEENNKRKEKYY